MSDILKNPHTYVPALIAGAFLLSACSGDAEAPSVNTTAPSEQFSTPKPTHTKPELESAMVDGIDYSNGSAYITAHSSRGTFQVQVSCNNDGSVEQMEIRTADGGTKNKTHKIKACNDEDHIITPDDELLDPNGEPIGVLQTIMFSHDDRGYIIHFGPNK